MISYTERNYLRELAEKQRELASSEENKQLEKRWYNHNDGGDTNPLIVIEEDTFYNEIRPNLICESPEGRKIEEELKRHLLVKEIINDDRVTPNFHSIYLGVEVNEFQIDPKRHSTYDEKGQELGHTYEHIINDLEEDFHKLKKSNYKHNLKETLEFAAVVEETIGDILAPRIRNNSLLWHGALTQKVVNLMGMENYFLTMYDQPEELHQLMDFIAEDFLECVRWQESEGILTPNWGNEHAGSNSFGFTDKLPKRSIGNDDLLKGKTDIKFSDLWLNTNSQETVGISAEMFKEYALPYYKKIAQEAGSTYYGCCEPVHSIFEGCLEEIPRLRKISVSAWCNEEEIAQMLDGKGIIYSRKPSPNFIGVGKELDEEAFRKYIEQTLRIAQKLPLEIIFRDIYTLGGNIGKLKRSVEIIRQSIG